MNRRTLSIVAAAVVVVLGGAAAAAVVITNSSAPSASPTATATPTPTATATANASLLPHVATTAGTVAGWQFPAPTAVGSVAPEVGDAADGEIALAIEAPTVDAPIRVATTTAATTAGQKYEVSARVRVLSTQKTPVAAALEVGDTKIALPALDATWTEITGDVVASGTATQIALRVDKPIVGLAIDDVTVAASDGRNVVPNPSFEDVAYTARLVNESLVLRTDTAALAVVASPGAATWKITRADAVETSGTVTSTGAVASIPITSLGEGYFGFQMVDASGAITEAPFMVLDGQASTQDSRFGVGLHVENDIYGGAARLARSLGIAEGRNDVLWRRNETTPGVYDWDPVYADSFDKLHQNGVKVLGIVNYGNKLYGSDKVPDNPEAIAAYGRYAAAMVKRFDLIGVEVFNEFNHARFNTSGCGTDPSCYIPLLSAVRDNVHAVDPKMPLVAGATANYDGPWFDKLWKDGGLAYADAISYHPYQAVSDLVALQAIIDQSRQSMQTNGGGTKPIWITELGAPSDPATMSVDAQAQFLTKVVATSLGSGVAKYFWYDLINDSPDPASHEGNFGLFYQPYDGVSALPPKPSAFAYGLMIHELEGKEAAKTSPALADGVVSFDFGSGASRTTIAWAKSATVKASITTSEALEVRATDGTVTIVEPVDGVAAVSIPAEGVYISPVGEGGR